MTDSFEVTECALLDAIRDQANEVIALSGKWGTGKTFLWDRLSSAAEISNLRPIRISLFGVRSINELKMRILQEAALRNDSKYKDYVHVSTGIVKGLINRYLPGAVAEDILLLGFRKLVTNTLIVIDDVERKHESLNILELMGFIDDCVDESESRFLLLLNKDQLKDREMWDVLHEKVMDLEIVLATRPAEAFEVANRPADCPYAPAVQSTLEILEINNIRAIRRVIRVVKALLRNTPNLDGDAVKRIIPSTVLIVSTFYRILDQGPSKEYILSFNTYAHLFSKNEGRTPDEIRWDDLCRNLGFETGGEFEESVFSYLETGLLNRVHVDKLLSELTFSAEQKAAKAKLDEFFMAYHWDSHRNSTSLVELARSLRSDVRYIDAGSITVVANYIRPWSPEVADELIGCWINEFLAGVDLAGITEDSFEISRREPIAPEILIAFKRLREQRFPALSFPEALRSMRRKSGWGNRELEALAQSSCSNCMELLMQLRNNALADFVLDGLWLMEIASGAGEPIQVAKTAFVDACKKICSEDANGRLCEIVKTAFKQKGLAEELK